IRQPLGHLDQTGSHEVRLIDADHLRTPIETIEYLRRAVDYLRLHAQVAVRHDLVVGIAVVDARFKDFDPLAGDDCPAEAANHLFALARKHGPADHFDPSDTAGDDIHGNRPGWHNGGGESSRINPRAQTPRSPSASKIQDQI